MDVFGRSGEVLSTKQIQDRLEYILNQCTTPGQPLGILTTQQRDVWGKAYKILKEGECIFQLDTRGWMV